MVQLTPDEVAAAVLARKGRGVGVGVLTVATVALWLLAAAWTTFLILEFRPDWRKAQDGVGRPVRDTEAKPAPAPAKPGAAPAKPATTTPVVIETTFTQGTAIQTTEPVYPLPPGYRQPTSEERNRQLLDSTRKMTWVLWWGVWQLAGIAALLTAALLSTLALILTVRRATLGQVRAVLADISQQLDALHKAHAVKN